jgi:MFS family permease
LGVLGSISYALFIIGIEVDFSKVKHTEHGGKEISFIMIFERVGASIGPLLGGFIASFINPQLTIFIATLIMVISLVPLFLSSEPVRTKQKLIIKGFPWRRHKRDFLSAPFVGVENIISIMIWPLFIALTIFQNNSYAAIGVLASVSTALALIAIYLIGRLIDQSKGLIMLKVGAILNAVLHIIRPFIITPLGALIVSFINEPLTASYRMPFSKGLYDAADSVTGYRIVYLTLFDSFRMLGLFIFWLGAYIASFFVTNDINILKFMFVIGGISSLGILLQKFPALKS